MRLHPVIISAEFEGCELRRLARIEESGDEKIEVGSLAGQVDPARKAAVLQRQHPGEKSGLGRVNPPLAARLEPELLRKIKREFPQRLRTADPRRPAFVDVDRRRKRMRPARQEPLLP